MQLLFRISYNDYCKTASKANMHGAVIQLFRTMVANGIFNYAIN